MTRLILNDGQELTIQVAQQAQDGALVIKTISADEDTLQRMFEDTFATKKMIVKERDEVLTEYNNYTKFDAIVKYTAGILGIVLYKEGESPDDRIAALEQANSELREQNDMLTACMLEMSELVYQ